MTDASKVWMPDTFFRNEKIGRSHKILAPNLYIRLFPNGDVLYSIRVSLVVACSMQLSLFPLDEQICHLNVASCECRGGRGVPGGWTSSDLVYMWHSHTALSFAGLLCILFVSDFSYQTSCLYLEASSLDRLVRATVMSGPPQVQGVTLANYNFPRGVQLPASGPGVC